MSSKISVSLPEEDLAVLDALVAKGLATGRSGAIRVAIESVRDSAVEAHLAQQFAAALNEADDQLADWDSVAGDGL